MPITLDKNTVYESEEKPLIPLNLGGFNKTEWKERTTAANFYFDLLLSFPSDAFWSTVVYSKVPMNLLDSFLGVFPRPYEQAKKKHYFANQDKEVHDLLLSCHQRILLFVLRLFTPVKMDFDEKPVTTDDIASLLHTHGVFTGQRLARLCAIYGKDHKAVLDTVLSRLFKSQPKLIGKVHSFLGTLHINMEKITKDFEESQNLDYQKRILSMSRALDESIQLFYELWALVRVVKIEDKAILKKFFELTEGLMEVVAITMKDQTVYELVGDEQEILNKLLCKRSLFLQHGMHFFVELYRNESLSDRERYEVIYDLCNFKESLTRFHFHPSINNLTNELKRFESYGICTKDHTKTCLNALNSVIKDQASEIRARLGQQGLLKSLGNFPQAKMRSEIDGIKELFPSYSKEMFHLLLRHFNYDADAVTHSLLEPENLPLQMQILLWVKEDFTKVQPTNVEMPQFTDEYEGDLTIDLNHLPKPSQPSTAVKGPPGFSLELDPSSSATAQPPPEEDSRPTVAKKLEKFREHANSLCGLVDTTQAEKLYESVQKVQIGAAKQQDKVKIAGKMMVKHDKERKLQMTLTDEEKAAIRASTLDKHYQIEYEDELEEQAIEAERERGFQITSSQVLDHRLASEFGVSGRFNRPKFIRDGDKYEDEYDDTYDDTQLYAMDIGAIKIEDEDTSKVLDDKAKKDRSKPDQGTNEKTKESSKKPQERPRDAQRRPQDQRGSNRPTPRESNEDLSRPPGFDRVERVINNPPRAITRPQHFRDAGATGASSQSNQSTASRPPRSGPSLHVSYDPDNDQPPRGFGQQARPPREDGNRPPRGGGSGGGSGGSDGRGGGGGGGPKRGSGPSNRGGNRENQSGPSHQGSSESQESSGQRQNSSYTGGRDRQMKERHKNQGRQRGADRKQRGGMF